MKNDSLIREEKTYKGSGALAKRLGVSAAHMSRVLHGSRKPGKALARRLHRLGIDLPEARCEM